MKKWFYSLDGKKQNIIIGVGWGLAALCCVIIGANLSTSAEPTALDYIFTMLFSVMVIFSSVFTYWKVKQKKNKKDESSDKSMGVETVSGKINNTDSVSSCKDESVDLTLQNSIVTKNNLSKQHFKSSVLLKSYASERINNLISEDIENECLSKSDFYNGYSNKDIEDYAGKTYQLEGVSFPCDIEPFSDTRKFGVYLKNYTGSKSFIGYIPDDKTNDVRKITLFGKEISGSASISGGKYKEFDIEKEKIVIKTDEYEVELSISYFMPIDADLKMNQILEEELEDSKMYKTIRTYIAGIKYNNDNGTNRMQIASNLEDGELLKLENYFYNEAKAVKILTERNEMIGNIPADLAETVFDYVENSKIGKVKFAPHFYEGRITDYEVDIYIKK